MLQGIDIIPNDIDILLSKEDIYKVDEFLKSYRTKTLKYSSNGTYKSHYNTYVINDTSADLVAEFQYLKRDGKWSEIVSINKFNVLEFEGMKLKLLPLELESKEYFETNRITTYNKIKEFSNTD
jgi:hypothetical protein